MSTNFVLDDTDDKIVDVDTSKDELTENFVCQDCESCFESKSGLKQHRELFHDAKSHACAICDEAFETLDQLKQHFLQVHEKSAKNTTRKRQNSQFYQCLVCQEKSTSAEDLKNHMVLIHDFSYKCESCNEEFGKYDELEHHTREQHAKDKNFQCDVCYKSFLRASVLMIHKNTVHGGQKFIVV